MEGGREEGGGLRREEEGRLGRKTFRERWKNGTEKIRRER